MDVNVVLKFLQELNQVPLLRDNYSGKGDILNESEFYDFLGT